eukprot:10099226-Alexandrium_andersonii.AAC.1
MSAPDAMLNSTGPDPIGCKGTSGCRRDRAGGGATGPGAAPFGVNSSAMWVCRGDSAAWPG